MRGDEVDVEDRGGDGARVDKRARSISRLKADCRVRCLEGSDVCQGKHSVRGDEDMPCRLVPDCCGEDDATPSRSMRPKTSLSDDDGDEEGEAGEDGETGYESGDNGSGLALVGGVREI